MGQKHILNGDLIVSGSLNVSGSTTSIIEVGGKQFQFKDGGGLDAILSTNYNNFRIKGNNNNGLYINLSGHVSATANLAVGDTYVNASTPPARLVVKGSGTTSSTTALLVQNANASSSLEVKDDQSIIINGSSSMNIPNSGSALTITRTGNYSNIGSQPLLRIVDDTAHSNVSKTAVYISATGASNNKAMEIYGGVGIGTPAYDLQLKVSYPTYLNDATSVFASSTFGLSSKSSISSFSAGNGGGISFWGDDRGQANAQAAFAGIRGVKENSSYLNSLGNLVFYVQSGSAGGQSEGTFNEAARFNSSGYLGIGTTTPSYTLDVSGSGRFTDGLTVTGSLNATGPYRLKGGNNGFISNFEYTSSTLDYPSFYNFNDKYLFANTGNNSNTNFYNIAPTIAVAAGTQFGSGRNDNGIFNVTANYIDNGGQRDAFQTLNQIRISPSVTNYRYFYGRAIYFAPTITSVSAPDFRFLENTTGDSYFNTTSGVVNIGSTTGLGARLGIKGSGTTSATTSLLVQNANASSSFQVLDNSKVIIGSETVSQGSLYIGHNGTSGGNNGTSTVFFASQFANYPYRLGAEGNGYDFYFRQVNGGQGSINIDFSGLNNIKYAITSVGGTNILYQSYQTSSIIDPKASLNSYTAIGTKNDLSTSTSAGDTPLIFFRSMGGSYYNKTVDTAITIRNGLPTVADTALTKNTAHWYRNGYIGIGTSTTLAATNTLKGALTINQGTEVGLKNTDASVSSSVITSGTSTTVSFTPNNGNNVIGYNIVVGTVITANGVSRKVTAVNYNTVTVDTAVDWSAGYTYTYRNPYVSIADGSTPIFDINSDGNVGIGTSNPVYILDVSGSGRFTDKLTVTGSLEVTGSAVFTEDITVNSLTVGKGGGNIISNTVVGFEAGYSNTTGNSNTAVGYQSQTTLTTGIQNTSIGRESLKLNTTGGKNTAIGQLALAYGSGISNNTAIGYQSLLNNTASNNTAVGYEAALSNTSAAGITAVGYQAMRNSVATEASNSAFGYQALLNLTTGTRNTAIGQSTLRDVTTGSYNTALGNNALQRNDNSNNTAVGEGTMYLATGGGNTAIGRVSMDSSTGSSNVAVGFGTLRTVQSAYNVAVGHTSLADLTTGSENTAVGGDSLANLTTASTNTAFGYRSQILNQTGAGNAAYGRYSLYQNISGSANTAVGTGAMYNNTASNNTAVGYEAAYSNTSGIEVTAVGYSALRLATGGYNTGIGHNAMANTTTGITNTAVGRLSLFSNITGNENTAIGNGALNYNIGGSSNTALGYYTLRNNTASNNTAVGFEAAYSNTSASGVTAIGYRSLRQNTGANNTALGVNTLYSNVTGTGNIGIGYQAGYSIVGSANIAIGSNALFNNTASNNVAVGFEAGYNNTSGTQITALGYQALRANTTGTANTAVGYSSLASNTGSSNTAVGYQAALSNTSGGGNSALGYLALRNNTTGASNTAIGTFAMYNSTGSRLVGIGVNALANSTAGENTAVGYEAALNNTSGGGITAVGYQALIANTTGPNNTALGYRAGSSNTSGDSITAVGYQALRLSTGNNNTAFGSSAATSVTTGTSNVAIGASSLFSTSIGSHNTAVGVAALYYNIGSGNTAIGRSALLVNTASNNTALGNLSGGNNITGSSNVFLGYQAGYNETNSDTLYIANTDTTSPLIGGDFSTGRVGINKPILDLNHSLDVSGSVGIYKSGSTVFDVQGSQGQLFSVVDELSGSLMSVNDISGLPILEVFSDDTVVMGTYGAPGLTVSGSAVTVATASAAPTDTPPEGTFKFATVGGSYYIYAYLGGAWRSGSLA